MIYFIQTKTQWFRIDYPCYGVMSVMEQLGNGTWEGDVEYLDEDGEWSECDHDYGDEYTPLLGLEPHDVLAVYTINHGATQDNLQHPMYQHIALVNGEEVGDHLSSGQSYFKLTMAAVPCDELFIPMFSLRNIFADASESDDALYQLFLNLGIDPTQAVLLANCWYKTHRGGFGEGGRYTSEDVYYCYNEDGAVFSNSKVGDVIHILKGGMPNFMSSVWGSLERGYPSYGVSVEPPTWRDQSTKEPHNSVMNRPHHMTDSTVLQSEYEGFCGRFLNNNTGYFSEEELKQFVKEIIKHVKGT